MGDTHYGNAMTEVALALAMAFFSIMILMMVSMGATGETASLEASADKAIMAKLAPNEAPQSQDGTAEPTAEDTLLIFYQGRFLDRDLKPVRPENINTNGRIILALAPDTAMAQALEARTRLKTDNLVVSMLNAKWLTALQRTQTPEK